MTVKEFFERYGATAAVIVVITLLAVLLPSNAKKKTSAGAAAGPTQLSGGALSSQADTAGAATGGASASSSGGSTGGGASGASRAAGTSSGGRPGVATATATGGVRFGSGPNCRADGRQKAISLYAPPCADWAKGTPNGGATGKGVIGNTIKLVRYLNFVDEATKAALVGAGASDTDGDTQRMFAAEVQYFNDHYETYGRQVVVEEVKARGKDDNEEAMRADAITIANDKKAFAVITNAPAGPPILGRELASRGVLCICTVSLGESFYKSLPPYVFTTLPTSEEYGANVVEYICKRLVGKGRLAKWAGDEFNPSQGFALKARSFGLIWYQGAGTTPEPGYVSAHDAFVKLLRQTCGVELAADFGYLFDLTKAGDQSTAMIGAMNNAHVTTVTFGIDPLYPIFFTPEASRQSYYPEWLNQGTALTDTTFFGRTYDQKQWKHAFGMSPLGVQRNDFSKSPGYREYHHARPADAAGKEGVSANVQRAPMEILFNGIHMAGPALNADNFAKGLFSYPPSGGDPTHPLVYFTRQDPAAIRDFTEIWWDPTGGPAKDEVNHTAAGLMMKSDGGQRYALGEWPDSDPHAFNPAGAVFSADSADPAHEQDGHHHPDAEKCLSCS